MRQLASWCLVVSFIAGCGKVASQDVQADAAVEADAAPDAPMPPPGEVCTPNAPGSVPADENGNHLVDEGCAWNFGSPHWMAPPVGVAWDAPDPTKDGNVLMPSWISADGNRLYVIFQTRFAAVAEVMLMTRTGRDAPFGPAAKVIGDDFPNFSVSSIALSQNELEAFVEARPVGTASTALELYRMTRAAVGSPFGKMEKLALSTANEKDERPFLRADGKELIWSTSRRLKRALRAGPGAPFGAAEPLTGLPDKESNSPYLSGDGHTLFFYGNFTGRYRLFRSQREDLATAAFSAETDVDGIDPSKLLDVFFPVVSESTRELFYGSNQPWNPGYYWIWRAEICRDGACAPRTVPCDGGVRSPDSLHCYKRLETDQTQAEAESACRRGGGHLADIQSPAEQALIWSTYGGAQSLWIGGFDDRGGVPECNTTSADGTGPFPCAWGWESGARWAYSAWGTTGTVAEPQEGGEEDCVVAYGPYGGLWADITCAYATRGVCETVLYPTW